MALLKFKNDTTEQTVGPLPAMPNFALIGESNVSHTLWDENPIFGRLIKQNTGTAVLRAYPGGNKYVTAVSAGYNYKYTRLFCIA